jgi:CubicO group peptidase (beta-lactamase class C family)
VRPLALIETWPVPVAAAATVRFDGTIEKHGPATHTFRLASISKVIVGWAALVAVEEGSLTLESSIGQAGCTLRHLLSHAGGYGFEGATPVATPGRRRIYSNTGIELAADALTSATGIALDDYLKEAVLDPLGMHDTDLRGSPAHAMWGTVDDLIRFALEVINPTLLSSATVAEATTTQFPELSGVVPGLGTFRPCPWGLGFEIRGHKHPHWTGEHNSPATFGHFGGAGTMMWIDPVNEMCVIALTNRKFDEWADDALRLWPELSDSVLTDEVVAPSSVN